MESLSCEVCGNADETPKHIVNGCAILASFWVAIGVDQMGHPSHVPKDEFGMFITLCYWQLWKRRNDMVFWGEALCFSFVQEWGRSLVMSVAGDKESTHRQMVFSLWFNDVNPSMSLRVGGVTPWLILEKKHELHSLCSANRACVNLLLCKLILRHLAIHSKTSYLA